MASDIASDLVSDIAFDNKINRIKEFLAKWTRSFEKHELQIDPWNNAAHLYMSYKEQSKGMTEGTEIEIWPTKSRATCLRDRGRNWGFREESLSQ